MSRCHRQRCLTAVLLAGLCVSGAAAHPLDLSGRPRNSLTGQFTWELQLANGMTARWKTTDGRAGAVQEGESTWFRGAKTLGSRRLDMVVASYGLLVTVERSEAEKRAASMAKDDVPGLDAAHAQLNAKLDEMTATCQHLPEPQQLACNMAFNVPVEALTKKIYDLEDAARTRADKIGAVCTVLKLKVRDGVVSGQADYCAGEPNVVVTGTVRPLGSR